MKSIQNFLNDNKGISFGFIVIAAFLILGTAVWIEFAPIYNNLFGFYNTNDVATGQASVQNQQAMTFHRNIAYVVPIILLLGVAAWGYIRALETRNQP